MNYSNHYFSLDIHEVASQVSLTVKKKETNRKLNITLTEKGQPYEIGADCAVVFSGKKANGKRLYNDCLVKNNVIEYIFTPQTASDTGIVECEIIVYGGDSQVLYSPSFSIVVYTPSFDVDGEGSEGGTGGGISEEQVDQKITKAKNELIGNADDEANKDTIKGAKQLSLDLMHSLENKANQTFVAKNQDKANVGKILVVGTDGNLTLADMPEGGTSGDVTGFLDESNNILLSGNIPDGTYTLKYENADGTYTEIGKLEVGAIPEPVPAYINQIPISTNADGSLFVGTNGEQGYKTGYRLSLSAGTEKALEGYSVTGFIPAKLGDVIRIKDIAIAEDNNINICFYDSNKQPINGGTGTYGTPLYSAFVTNGTEANGVYTTTLYERVHAAVGANFAYIRIGSTQITADSILTVNQEIV